MITCRKNDPSGALIQRPRGDLSVRKATAFEDFLIIM